MDFTNEQYKEIKTLAREVVDWLRANADSRTKVIIDCDRFDIVQDVCGDVFCG